MWKTWSVNRETRSATARKQKSLAEVTVPRSEHVKQAQGLQMGVAQARESWAREGSLQSKEGQRLLGGAGEDRRSWRGVTGSDQHRKLRSVSDFPFNSGSGQWWVMAGPERRHSRGGWRGGQSGETGAKKRGAQGTRMAAGLTMQHPSQFPRNYNRYYYLILRNAGWVTSWIWFWCYHLI